MVLATHKKNIFVILFFLLNTALVFSQQGWFTQTFFSSGLIQYGDNIDRERLELLENRQIVNIAGAGDTTPRRIGMYTIHNRGEAYRATLGLLFREIHGIPSFARMEIQFFVDGEQVPHTERVHLGSFVMGETTHELSLGESTAWALINVFFPASSTITIEVQHMEGSWRYNDIPEVEPFTNLAYWRGHTRFILEVTNGPVGFGGWISNIQFFHVTDRHRDINTMDYLRNLQSLQTELMHIQRLSGSTFRIDFTGKFMSSFQRRFVINTRVLADIEQGAFLYFSYPGRELSFYFGRGLSGSIIAPYELIFLTNAQLRIMRNVIFARHGFIFQSQDLLDIFTNTVWFWHPMSDFVFYVPNPNFHESMLTDAERANIATIQRLEALVGD